MSLLMCMDAPTKQRMNKQHNVPSQHKSSNKMNTINMLTLMLSLKKFFFKCMQGSYFMSNSAIIKKEEWCITLVSYI